MIEVDVERYCQNCEEFEPRCYTGVSYKYDKSGDMERTVRIMQQSPLVTRKYMDRKTGDEKVINSVTLKLTDGIDTFLGEITGERAVNCPKFDIQRKYRVQCSMVVREWNSQQTGEAMQATTIYVDKINLM